MNMDDLIHSILIYGYTMLKQERYTKENIDIIIVIIINNLNLFSISLIIEANSYFIFKSSL